MSIYDLSGNKLTSDNNSSLFDIPIITKELPTLFIVSNKDYAALTKEDNARGTLEFVDGCNRFELPIKFKLQGSGSLQCDKKNLNISFYVDEDYDDKQKIRFNSWYPTSKIHLKANEYDFSMCRNSVGTRLAYKMCGKSLPNGAEGYIDSFPCIMYYNGVYMGCHTVNLPQDGKTYNFNEEKETAGKHLAYRCNVFTQGWTTSSNWEYRGDADETAEMRSVFDVVHAIMTTSGLTKETIEAHFDVETLLSYLVFCQIGLCVDSLVNNWTMVTWDGVKWYHTFYDLDICFGIGGGQDGADLTKSATADVFDCVQGGYNTFFAQVKELYADEMKTIYAKMRGYGADVNTIMNAFRTFQNKWGWQNIESDRTKWGYDKDTTVDVPAVEGWLESRFAWLDTLYGFEQEV